MKLTMWWTAVLAVLAGLYGCAVPVGATPERTPEFIEATCDLPKLTPEIAARFRCGTVEVPRLYENPGAGTFKVAVVVVKSDVQPSAPDPVVYLQGGPGFDLTVNAVRRMADAIAPRRDLILIDQRGSGRSEPSVCPGAAGRWLGMFAGDFSVAEMFSTTQSIALACADEAREQGIPLEAFGTTVSAADIDRVRKALGIEMWNAYGISYGTTLGMTLVERYPDTLRSLVLDSVFPPDPLPVDPRTAFAESRSKFFALCASDPACASKHADLGDVYEEALSRLGERPLDVPLPEEFGLPGNRAVLNRGDLELIVQQTLYQSSAYVILPAIIRAAYEGNGEAFSPMLIGLASKLTPWSIFAYTAVECRDRPRHREGGTPSSGIDVLQLWDVCPDWAGPGPALEVPGNTAVPTLLLAGAIDPVTPPAYARSVADTMGTLARYVEFEGVGHSVQRSSECGRSLVVQFFKDPTSSLDSSCSGTFEPIRFR